jgi:hypothetical protein
LDVPHPIVFAFNSIHQYIDDPPPFPWLARRAYHDNGKDIVPLKSMKDVFKLTIDLATLARPIPVDFISVYVPTDAEYRVWTFKNKVLATYAKTFQGQRFTGAELGFDFYHSFLFENRNDLMDDAKLCKIAVDATKAIELDFGAVDVLLGKDRKYYVLEVNSMPNIDCLTRVSGIRLTKAISNWVQNL